MFLFHDVIMKRRIEYKYTVLLVWPYYLHNMRFCNEKTTSIILYQGPGILHWHSPNHMIVYSNPGWYEKTMMQSINSWLYKQSNQSIENRVYNWWDILWIPFLPSPSHPVVGWWATWLNQYGDISRINTDPNPRSVVRYLIQNKTSFSKILIVSRIIPSLWNLISRRHHCCRSASQLSKRYDNSNYQFRTALNINKVLW